MPEQQVVDHYRAGLRLVRWGERRAAEECARICEKHGSPELAEAIRRKFLRGKKRGKLLPDPLPDPESDLLT